MKTLLAAAGLITAVAPAAAQTRTETTVTRTTTRPGVVVTTHTDGYAPAPVYAPPPQDTPYLPYEPLPSDAEAFGGARIEVLAGFDRIGGDDQVLFDRNDGSRNGFTYGGEAGFDVPVGRTLLIGGYAGAEGSTVKECFALFGASGCARAPFSFTAGGRIGIAASPSTLVYVKGGYTRSRIKFDATLVTNPPRVVEDSQMLNGFHVGGGLEQRFGANAYGKIEYDYTRLRGYDALSAPGTTDDEFNRHQVKLGLGLRM